MRPILIVDAANVIGSVPDGWWRDRAGATGRLRDALAAVQEAGITGDPQLAGPLEIILVVEGAARAVSSRAEVTVVPAAGAGDDTIVELVAGAGGSAGGPAARLVVVVTADRDLRRRVQTAGARVYGPRDLRRSLPEADR